MIHSQRSLLIKEALLIIAAAIAFLPSTGFASTLATPFFAETGFERLRKAIESTQNAASLKDLLKDSKTHALSISQRITDAAIETTKFQHYYKGVEVLGSMAYHHQTIAGSWVDETVSEFDLDTNPNLSQETAVAVAKAVAGDRLLAQKPQLKILPSADANRLVYWVEMNQRGVDAARDLIIDAHSGEVLANLTTHLTLAPVQVYSAKNQGAAVELFFDPVFKDQLHHCMVRDLATGTMKEMDGDSCNNMVGDKCQITLDGDIQEKGIPIIIIPKNCQHVVVNSVPNRSADAAARRATLNSVTVLRYYADVHGRNSYDDRGSALINVVHVGEGYDNAHWDSRDEQMAYGDGDGKVLGDFTRALDVAGHEMTHGVVSKTANLIGMGDAGALNEAFADFFGKMAENKNDWVIGKKLFLDQTKARGIRDLQNPATLSYRDYENGKLVTKSYPKHMNEKAKAIGECNEENDRCWVHINATIPGHAFYQLVQAIGKEKAEKLLYTVLTHSLGKNDDFVRMAAAAKKTCKGLMDATTCEQVNQAFATVGL